MYSTTEVLAIIVLMSQVGVCPKGSSLWGGGFLAYVGRAVDWTLEQRT